MTRHSWGEPTRIPHGIALPRKTERQCVRCDLVKVTWHGADGSHRTEFWRGLDRVECVRTPACEMARMAEDQKAA